MRRDAHGSHGVRGTSLARLLAAALAMSVAFAAPASASAGSPAAPASAGSPAAANEVPPPLTDPESSAITGLMMDVAKGAAGEFGSTLVGWLLGSGGSANQDQEVLDQISSELTDIENTLNDIEDEISQLIGSIDKLDCDTWIQDAEPMVFAISNLWDPNSMASGPLEGSPPQQSYSGILAETQTNSYTLADLEMWSDQVLNNNGQGIGGQSVLDYLQDLANVLIPSVGETGLLESCLSLPGNLPSAAVFAGQTDDVYYNTVVAPLINYYYAIQAQGVTMVVEALNFEAWQAAGSPESTDQTINGLPESICGDTATGQVLEYCENATWAFLGEDGQSGVRGRVAAQFELGGAPFTTDPAENSQPVHRYVTNNNLWASSPSLFSSLNSPASCPELDSNAPCGILAGIYSDTTVGGSYGGYGAGYGGTWVAAPATAINTAFVTGPSFTTAYSNVGDYLMRERRFLDLPDNTVFITNDVFFVQPYSDMSVGTNVYAFTDTGLTPGKFYPFYTPDTTDGYISDNGLQHLASAPYPCQIFDNNPALPPPSENGGFYVGSSEFCPGNEGWWTAGPPGWTLDVGAANKHPQFRLPVVFVKHLTCADDLSPTNIVGEQTMCGNDFYAWLDAQVPPAAPRELANVNNGQAHGRGGAQGGPNVLREPVVGGMVMSDATSGEKQTKPHRMKNRTSNERGSGPSALVPGRGAAGPLDQGRAGGRGRAR